MKVIIESIIRNTRGLAAVEVECRPWRVLFFFEFDDVVLEELELGDESSGW